MTSYRPKEDVSERRQPNPATAQGSGATGDILRDESTSIFDALTRIAPSYRYGAWKEVLALLWIFGSALGVLLPVLLHGKSFGEFDALNQFGVLSQHGVVVHNVQAGDQTDAAIPWTSLAWTQIHEGHLPLWNQYEALGIPLTFAWQSATFSVPMLISYLFPVAFLSTISVVLTLVIAGSGCYLFCRLIGLDPLSSAFAATVFELSGPMVGWLGWAHASAAAWSGWVLSAAVLVLRGRHQLRCIVFLALVIAAMVYAGVPEVLVLVGLAVGVFVALIIGFALGQTHDFRPIARPLLGLIAGGVSGFLLSAPLLLPGLQLITVSQRGLPGGDPAELLSGNPPIPAENLSHFLFQGFDGLPIAGNHWFGYTLGYSETAAYIGAIGLALVVVGVAVHWKTRVVLAMTSTAVVLLAVAFVPFVVSVMSRLPFIGDVLWQRALLPLAFALATLAGIGMHSLVRSSSRRVATKWALASFLVIGGLLAILLVFSRGIPPSDSNIRLHSFAWPILLTVVGIGISCLLLLSDHGKEGLWKRRRGTLRVASCVILLACETTFLIASGASLWTSSNAYFPATRQEAILKRHVGNSLVGFGASLCFFPPGLGIIPNAESAYGIRELGLYDPMIPSEYFTAWRKVTHHSAGIANDFLYCPAITSLNLARLYGVEFVLEPRTIAGPTGSIFVTSIGDESLYQNSGLRTSDASDEWQQRSWRWSICSWFFGEGCPPRPCVVGGQNKYSTAWCPTAASR